MEDEKELVIIVKAKDLVKHTFKMATAKRFPNKYRFTIANRVCDLVLDRRRTNLTFPTRRNSGNGSTNRKRR